MLSGADIRGFYAALGVELPGWAQREASVACIATPERHAHGDRDPSCSVNVENGAWHCWGRSATGGAYDAALARGRTAREAMDLLIAYGLAERRASASARSGLAPAGARAAVQRDDGSAEPQQRELAIGEQELTEARARLGVLHWPPRVLRVERAQVWSRATMVELGCGWERGRVVIPIRDAGGELRGALCYAPSHDRAPKMLAVSGTRLGLVPHPVAASSQWLVLVEGPPDMISARSRGLPALAVPGDEAWDPGWAQLLVGRSISVIMDCDRPGREAAAWIASDLKAADVHGSLIDLAPGRDDGPDLTDWLHDHREWPLERIRAALGNRAQAAARVA